MAPILIDHWIVSLSGVGLQAIEGRTQIGILQGCLVDELRVADSHVVWVARRRTYEELPCDVSGHP